MHDPDTAQLINMAIKNNFERDAYYFNTELIFKVLAICLSGDDNVVKKMILDLIINNI